MLRPRSSRKRAMSGFTLIEVLLVLVILVVLGGIAVTNFTNIRVGAQENAAKAQVDILDKAMDYYQLDMGDYPSSLEDLMIEPSFVSDAGTWRGPYMKDLTPDPWGQTYYYDYPGNWNTTTYDIYSAGPDKSPNTEDDIGNWKVVQ